ncbi:PucR family transcriptional regulator [Actinomycetospora straminea]|uniref:PucR family transcriptional regulator n=1 Tax=Actinomycetospora straminea TaxID=663607 RepID=UPI00236602E7|nr:PucR family transcriptional regulator [Actinomycetospora straminea]MDD7933877.1 helix-turn-helix domain-containing protein [Actinomycetospora straminea]
MAGTPTERLAEALAARADGIARAVHRDISAHIPTYDRVPRVDVEASVVEIVDDVGAVLRAGAVPAPASITQAEQSSRARAKQGVPIHEIMHAFRFSMGAIRDAVAAIAGEVGIDAAETVRLLTLMWSYSDAYTAEVVAVYRQSDIESALEQARRTQQFLLGLLDGTLEGADLTLAASSLLLDPTASYRAVRARPPGGDAGPLLHELQRQGARHAGVSVLAAIGAQCVGVVPFRPEPVGDDGVIALGPAVRVAELPASFRSAHAVLAAATTLGLHGVHDLPDLSWRAAAVNAGELNGLLRERYLAPLVEQGEFGELILEAVAVYLAADRNVPRAARAVPVHVNTLRYRLRRFEELTGRRLDSTETIVEVSFALGVTARSV